MHVHTHIPEEPLELGLLVEQPHARVAQLLCMDTCADMCMDMYADMCADMRIDTHTYTCPARHFAPLEGSRREGGQEDRQFVAYNKRVVFLSN